MNNSPDFVKDIDNSEENYLYTDFKKTVKHSLQNLKYMFKQRHPIAFNMHPVNQTTFFKVPMFPGGKSCSNAVTNKTAEKYIFIFGDSVPCRIKIHDFNKAFTNEKAKHLLFLISNWNSLHVDLKMCTSETVLILVGINAFNNNVWYYGKLILYLVNQASNKSVNDTSQNVLLKIKKLRIKNSNEIKIGSLSINSLVNILIFLFWPKSKLMINFLQGSY